MAPHQGMEHFIYKANIRPRTKGMEVEGRTECPPFFSHPISPSLVQARSFFARHLARGESIAADAAQASVRMVAKVFIL